MRDRLVVPRPGAPVPGVLTLGLAFEPVRSMVGADGVVRDRLAGAAEVRTALEELVA